MTMQKQLLAVPLQTVMQKLKTLSCKCKQRDDKKEVSQQRASSNCWVLFINGIVALNILKLESM